MMQDLSKVNTTGEFLLIAQTMFSADGRLPLYRKHGNVRDCQIGLYDCARVELPEMRKTILEWLDRYLI